MTEKNTCILLYTTFEDVWQAVEQLQAKEINLAAVSVVGNANDEEGQLVEVCPPDGYKPFQGTQTSYWKSLWEVLDGKLFFVISELGTLFTAGAIVSILLKEKDDIDIHGRFSALAAALFRMGVPANSIRQYEAELKAGNILFIVNSKRAEVERSCKILHSEMQQATVHLA